MVIGYYISFILIVNVCYVNKYCCKQRNKKPTKMKFFISYVWPKVFVYVFGSKFQLQSWLRSQIVVAYSKQDFKFYQLIMAFIREINLRSLHVTRFTNQ